MTAAIGGRGSKIELMIDQHLSREIDRLSEIEGDKAPRGAFMSVSSLNYKNAVVEELSAPHERYAGRGRIVAHSGFSLSVKYECDFCSRKKIWEGIFSGHLMDIERHFFAELKLVIEKKIVMDCQITTYSTENASFTRTSSSFRIRTRR